MITEYLEQVWSNHLASNSVLYLFVIGNGAIKLNSHRFPALSDKREPLFLKTRLIKECLEIVSCFNIYFDDMVSFI